MNRRRLLVALVPTFLAAECGSGFEDEAEELAYLKAVQSPTPRQ